MTSFDQIISEYKTTLELRTFSESQHRVINDLSKKIQKLEEENKSLKSLVDKITPIDQASQAMESNFGSSDPEIIARTQLALLKRTSMSGEELTMEEAKKTQIFTDVLLKSTEKDKKSIDLTALDTKDLLAALEGPQ